MPDRHANPNSTTGNGPAIQMDPRDHKHTSSNGQNGAASAEFRDQTAQMIDEGRYRDMMAREVNDVRRASTIGSDDIRKYNDAMKEALEYAEASGQLPPKSPKP